MAIFPGAIATDADLYIAVNTLSALLTDNPLTIGATTVNVNSTTLFPTVGFISIDAEIIKYTGKTATSFTGCTRGADGSTAAAHSLGAQVDHNVIAAHHNVLKDEIIAVQQNLSDRIGLSTTQLLAPLGSNGAPTYSFTGDPNTGMYSGSADRIDFTTGGVTTLRLRPTFTEALVKFHNVDGTVALPAYTFDGDTDTGIYRIASGSIGFSTNGVLRFSVDTTNGTFNLPLVISPTTNQLVFGTTNTTTINATAPSASRIYAIPDAGTNASFVMTQGTQTIDGLTTFSSRVTFPAGSAGTPSIAFTGFSTDGFYHHASDGISVSLGGDQKWRFLSSGILTAEDAGSLLYVAAGSVSAPSLTFDVDTNTGLYNIADGSIGVSSNGTNIATFASTGVSIKGTTTNNSASALFVGEYIESVISASTNYPASPDFGDLTSISLTAGDWDVSASIEADKGTATWAQTEIGISTTSGNSVTGLVIGNNRLRHNYASSATTPDRFPASIPSYRISLSATTTVYLKYSATYSAGQPTARGRISARRIR